jgi:undecaprenyl diphosphate synthase
MIMDGNRRWAKERGLPTLEGHKRGYEKLTEVVQWMQHAQIPHLVVYAFSTENWNRAEKEVRYLMKLFRKALDEWLVKAVEQKVRVRIAGERERFTPELQEAMQELERETRDFNEHTLTLCLSYGGRAELVHAAREASKEAEITEESLARNLWTKDMPDPDILIRTGGERRLSNFLPWQSTYSELFFVDTYWPDFSEDEFGAIIDDYNSRQRRFGV